MYSATIPPQALQVLLAAQLSNPCKHILASILKVLYVSILVDAPTHSSPFRAPGLPPTPQTCPAAALTTPRYVELRCQISFAEHHTGPLKSQQQIHTCCTYSRCWLTNRKPRHEATLCFDLVWCQRAAEHRHQYDGGCNPEAHTNCNGSTA